jgi:hypothetical protein
VRVAVAASTNDFSFAVIDFTNPATPTVASANPGFGPYVVDADGTHAAVGSANGDTVALYDLSIPKAPIKLATIGTGLSGIGSISIDGMRVLVGESNGLRIALIDFSAPATPKLLSTINSGLSSVGSVALSGSQAIAAGPNDTTIRIINYSSPMSPSFTTFDPALFGPLVADLDGTHAVVGDQTGTFVTLINLAGPTVIGTVNTTLSGISSVSLSGSLVAASSTNDARVALVSFATPGNPTVQTFNPGVAGGSSVWVGTELLVGAINGSSVKLFGLAGTAASLLGTANSGVASIASLSLTTFAVAAPPAIPNIVVIPPSLSLGPVAVCQSASNTVNVRNVGNAPLSITKISATAPFTVTPNSATTLAQNTAITLQVTFTPTAAGATNGTLTIDSNDPDSSISTVLLHGTATPTPPPEIALSPVSLNFGASIPDYFFGMRLAVINKSPCTVLKVTGLSTGNAVFPITNDPAPTVVPTTTALGGFTVQPNKSHEVIVVFAPPAVGPFGGTLTITSNDPAHPIATVPLNGVGVLPKPTAACLLLDRSDFIISGAGEDANVAALDAAVLLFLDLLPEQQGDYIGSVTNLYTGSIPLTHMTAVNAAAKNAIRLKLPFITAAGSLNVGGTLDLAGFMVTDEVDNYRKSLGNPPPPPQRRVIVAFTGGRELHPPFINDVTIDLVNHGIEVYAVSIGSGSAIDAAALSQLAATSKGKFFVSEDLLLLRKNFVQVLADAFRMNMAADPIATIGRNGTRDVKMRVTKCERRLRFVCAWDDFDEQLGVQVIAPDDTVFTPASPASNPLVRYLTRPGSAVYDIMLPPIDDNDVIGPQVVGTWTMRIGARGLKRDAERFTTALLVESDTSLGLKIRRAVIGDTATLRLDLLHAGGPLPGATVKVTVDAPLISAQEVKIREVKESAELATRHGNASGHPYPATADTRGTAPSPRELSSDDELSALVHDRLTPSQRAALFRPTIDIPYGSRTAHALPTTDFGYELELPAFVKDGIHQITVEVRAPACGGILSRYLKFAIAPMQRVNFDTSRFKLEHTPKPGEPVTLHFTPCDAAGNLMGVGLKPRMNFMLSEGGRVTRVVDHFDGSYSIQLAMCEGGPGRLAIEIDGVSGVVPIPLR